MNDIPWQPLAKQLAETLADNNDLTDPRWQVAFEQVPRHRFVPRFWALDSYNRPAELVDGADPTHRDRWLTAVYSNQFLVTQWQPQGDRRIVTSSSSQPSLVAQMLHLLDVQPGQRVLEIGTGTGYNTALLCHHLGPDAVATIDIDPVLVAEAAERLRRLDMVPTAEGADGADGLPAAAPYDRLISTCSASRVPEAWIDQLTEGGLLVAPLTFGGALAVLRKGDGQLTGRLAAEQAYFMPLHAAGEPMPDGFTIDIPAHTQMVYRCTTDVPLETWADPGFRLWLALTRPGLQLADSVDDQLNRVGMVAYDQDAKASADYTDPPDGPWPVLQDQQRLWDTVEAAWATWQQHHQPDRTRIGITARADGEQYAWLDHPDGPVRWPLPAASGGS